jgi:hypothetical protein
MSSSKLVAVLFFISACGSNNAVPGGDECPTTETCVGTQGPEGPAGPQGPAGAVGPQGAKGDKGDPGAVGAQGPQGTPGAPGLPGAQGPQGDVGPIGPIGPQGVKGNTGNTGAVGPAGPAGAAGVSMKVIDKDGIELGILMPFRYRISDSMSEAIFAHKDAPEVDFPEGFIVPLVPVADIYFVNADCTGQASVKVEPAASLLYFNVLFYTPGVENKLYKPTTTTFSGTPNGKRTTNGGCVPSAISGTIPLRQVVLTSFTNPVSGSTLNRPWTIVAQ